MGYVDSEPSNTVTNPTGVVDAASIDSVSDKH